MNESDSTPRIADRYELGEVLGRGGMAEVRKATDVRLGRTVAIKRLRTDLVDDATFQARFRREAQAAAGLNHPSIAAVYDTGEEQKPGSLHPEPYIVMEYVPGRTLRDILREGRRILPERALEIVAGVLDALDYSHRAGIVHRDIKPANVMLTPKGEVKVMDFGIARAIADATSTMTQTAAVIGTAQYLSPEQARGETVDSRSDVYSTGCLLFELLTGRPPFVGDSPVAVAYQHVREQPPLPSSIDPEISSAVDAIVLKALAKRTADRYQTAAAMRADIDSYLNGQPIDSDTATAATAYVAPVTAEPTSVYQAPPVIPPPTPMTSTGPLAPVEPERGRRWPVAVALLLLLGLIGGAIALNSGLFDEAAAQVTVPRVTGMTIEDARSTLAEAGLVVGDETPQASDTAPEGEVLNQDPGPLVRVEEGSAINLVVSAGQATTTVPRLIGLTRAQARGALEEANLVARFEARQSDEPRGTVVESSPSMGQEVEVGSPVVVYLSTGPAEVPGVVGLDQDEATDILDRAGFEVRVIEDPATEAEPGTVLSQTPEEGEAADRGSTVFITVSTFVEPTPTPTPSETPTAEPTATPSVTPTP